MKSLASDVPTDTKTWLGTGLLGSLTTFSTFGYQSVALAIDGDYRLAGLNLLTNVVIGFTAVVVGLKLAEALVKV